MTAQTTENDVARVRAQIDACGLIPSDWALQMCDEIERLRRGEFICQKCGLRKNAETPDANF